MSERHVKTYDSLLVINYLIKRATELRLPSMNITKAQKLMYCVYGVLLGKFNYRISNETPETGKHGPVFPRALRSMNALGFAEYRLEAVEFGDDLDLPSDYKALFDDALKLFGKYSAEQLCRWTCEKGSPWSLLSSGGVVLHEQMDDEAILNYFKENVLA